jgi:hypothetical protein
MYDNEVNRYVNRVVKELSQNQWDLLRMEPTNLVGGGRVRQFIVPGSSSSSAFASEGADGEMMMESPDFSGGKKPKGKTAKFLRSVGHFVKPLAPAVKKIKKVVAPMAQQALTDLAVQSALGGKKPKGKTAKFLRSVGNFVKPIAPLVKKVKKVVAPMAQQALQQGAMQMAMGAGMRPRLTGGRAPSAWIQHVKDYQAKHGCSYKQAMSAAKSTYRK